MKTKIITSGNIMAVIRWTNDVGNPNRNKAYVSYLFCFSNEPVIIIQHSKEAAKLFLEITKFCDTNKLDIIF